MAPSSCMELRLQRDEGLDGMVGIGGESAAEMGGAGKTMEDRWALV